MTLFEQAFPTTRRRMLQLLIYRAAVATNIPAGTSADTMARAGARPPDRTQSFLDYLQFGVLHNLGG